MERRTRSYLQLMKPGITLSNTLSAVAGYLLASSIYGFELNSFVAVAAGIALIIASACIMNNIMDRDIDARMARTRRREIAAGKIDINTAHIYSVVMASAGFWFLLTWTNWITALLGVLAYVWYVVIYGVAKRTTPLSTIIGAVCGALPPMAGYVALSGQIDWIAIFLFWILFVWQLPHFYAIAMFRANDYKQAGLPVWPIKFGMLRTRRQVMLWMLLFALTVPWLTFAGITGVFYLMSMATIGFYWVIMGLYSQAQTHEAWAREMFGVSIAVLLVTLMAISVGGYLP